MDKYLTLLFEGTDFVFNVRYYKLYWSQDPEYQFRIYDLGENSNEHIFALYQKDGTDALAKGNLLIIDQKLEELWQKMKKAESIRLEKELSNLLNTLLP